MEELNLDQDFLMQFSCMGTQDKDVLVSQLHAILDSQLSREGCAFFLEMTNWNLQASVGAFYDHYTSEGGVMPEMTLVERKSIKDDQNPASLTLPANTVFTETWTLRNTGPMPWPLGVHLTVKTGELLSNLRNLHLPMLAPGGETTVTLEFHAPASPGVFHCQWRMCTTGGALFGDPVWVIVHVPGDDSSVAGLADQLSTITTHEADMESESTENTRLEPEVAPNPFATPTSYQDHSFGSGSMMTGPNSVPAGTCLERLLLHNSPEHMEPDPNTAMADSTTHSNSVPTNQKLEWNSSLTSDQNQTLEWNSRGCQPIPGTASVSSNTGASLMEENNSETSTT